MFTQHQGTYYLLFLAAERAKRLWNIEQKPVSQCTYIHPCTRLRIFSVCALFTWDHCSNLNSSNQANVIFILYTKANGNYSDSLHMVNEKEIINTRNLITLYYIFIITIPFSLHIHIINVFHLINILIP